MAFGGADDEWARPDELAAWHAQTRGAFQMQLFPGGHFYLQAVLPQLVTAVAQALTTDEPSGC
jgi:surfactin synthase thioesterase subunit